MRYVVVLGSVAELAGEIATDCKIKDLDMREREVYSSPEAYFRMTAYC